MRCVSFSPDGLFLASGGEDRNIRVWSIPDGKLVDQYEQHPAMIWSVDFSPDGQLVASGGERSAIPDEPGTHGEGGFVSLRNVHKAEPYRPSRMHNARSTIHTTTSGWVNDLVCTNDGRSILVATDDGTITQLDAQSCEVVSEVDRLSEAELALTVTPDDRFLVSGGVCKGIRIHELTGDRSRETLPISVGPTKALSLSLDGKWLASGSDDGIVRLWNVDQHTCVIESRLTNGTIECLQISPDGERIACGSNSGSAVIWNISDNHQEAVLPHNGALVRALVFSSDGDRLLTGSDDSLGRLWDVRSGKLIHEFNGHHQIVGAVAFSPDGRTVITGSHDSSVRFWSVASGEGLLTLRGFPEEVQALRFSTDGGRLIIGRRGRSSTGTGNLDVWKAASDKDVFEDLQDAVAANPADDDSKLALAKACWRQISSENTSGEDRNRWEKLTDTLLTELETGSPIRPTLQMGITALRAALSEQTRTAGVPEPAFNLPASNVEQSLIDLADHYCQSAGNAPYQSIRIRERAVERMLRAISILRQLQPSQETGRLLTTCRARLEMIRSAPGLVQEFAGHDGWIADVEFSPDQTVLWSVGLDETLRKWNLQTGKQVLKIDTGSYSNCLAVSPSGRLVATASFDSHEVSIRDAQSGKLLKSLDGHLDIVHAMQFSSDEQTLVTTSNDQRLRFWELNSSNCFEHRFNPPHKHPAKFLSRRMVSPQLAALSASGNVEFWSIGHRQPVRVVEIPLLACLTSADVASTENRIIAGFEDGRVAVVDDPSEGILTLGSHSERVACVRLSTDGHRAASIGNDGTTRLWNVDQECEITRFVGRKEGRFEFSPDGNYLAATVGEARIRLWRLPESRHDDLSPQ